MSDLNHIRPASILSIKRLAKAIKRDRGLSHSQALDAAAQQGGFSNFIHAKRDLGSARVQHATPLVPTYPVYISVRWQDDQRQRGRVTLITHLSVPWHNLITRQEFKKTRVINAFRPYGANQIVATYPWQSEQAARDVAFGAARTLQFIEATGLAPSKSYSRAYPRGDSSNAIPGHDHASVWYHRRSKAYVFVDEPYVRDAFKDQQREKRDNWAKTHGFVIRTPSWAGMHAPVQGTQVFLISAQQNTALLDEMTKSLNALPRNMVKEAWEGESVSDWSSFVPPGQPVLSAEMTPKRSKATRGVARGRTVPYRTLAGTGRMPAQRMPADAHQELGRLLTGVYREAHYRTGVVNRIGEVRNELDEWFQREYSTEEVPQDLYYGNSGSTAPVTRKPEAGVRQRWIMSLEHAKVILAEQYEDCAPVRALLGKLDRAISSIEKWQP